MPQTVESPSRPGIIPFNRVSDTAGTREKILRDIGSGILVTGFNGGNSNPVTGAFSFGIEGFRFENGEILYPVSEMLVTGDILSLWAKSLFAGDDPVQGTRWQIPTLAFDDVDFNG